MKTIINRVLWVDALKGIAILWLIVYHFYIFNWLRSPVPVFFFLSGLFFSEGKTFGSFVGKKANALLVPFLFFFFLGITVSFLKSLAFGESYSFPQLWRFATIIPGNAKVTNPLGVGAIWFLIVLFELYIVYYLLRKITNKKWLLLFITLVLWLLSALFLYRYAIGSLFYIFYAFSFLPFFVVSHLFTKCIMYKHLPLWVVVLSMGCYLLTYIPVSVEASSGGDVILRIKDLLSSMGLVLMLVFYVKYFFSYNSVLELKLSRLLLFEGRNSITILGVHLIVMSVASNLLKDYLSNKSLYYLVLFVIVFIVSNICILLFNKYIPFFVNGKKK